MSKLSLNALHVQSFITNENSISGGNKTKGKNCDTAYEICVSGIVPCNEPTAYDVCVSGIVACVYTERC